MVEVTYMGDWPDDVKATISLEFDPMVFLLPSWCRSLFIYFENEPTERQAAAVSTNYEGRHINMFVRPNWFMETADDRERVLLHEITHTHTQPIRNVFSDAIAGQDEQFRDFAWARFKETWEGAVEDLAWTLYLAMKK
ncbi:hypothetical protein LCGC14_0251760 [marine sediment metagenome]|uniref:DUF4157 domain-containing protein n=1 Tax=marine sediment metagenome TaxID=412755 RepID=A0A0F9U918_9ZZZZ